ncbi:type-F conjugative transfer system protein TraW [Photobacterium damselae]|uniref:type-F conjugative transfer system protein TraW n=1 Tax=Photobacterium damselae TaxID=38293 RepID=UPI0040686574
MRFYWLSVALLLSGSIMAKDLGVVANTYPIQERDMLDWIQQRLSLYQQTGELANMEDNFKTQVKNAIVRPPPVKGLNTTQNPKTFYVDPTLTLAQDIKDHSGNVLFTKGLKINPFDVQTWPKSQQLPNFMLTKQLVFIDGDDAQQLHFAKRYQVLEAMKPHPLAIKWILINGEPDKVSRQLGVRIYFDQGGRITRQLQLQHIPTVAKQKGTQWQLQEFDVSQESMSQLKVED